MVAAEATRRWCAALGLRLGLLFGLRLGLQLGLLLGRRDGVALGLRLGRETVS